MDVASLRDCSMFFLPVNPGCTTTTTTTIVSTTTTTTQISTTTTTTDIPTTTTTTTDGLTTTTTTTEVPITTTTTTTEPPVTTTTTTEIPTTTTTTTVEPTTTTTTTIEPTTTTTTTLTPTTTTTTTGVPIVSACGVFLVDATGKVWNYEPSLNTCTLLFSAGFVAADIANTDTKLWLSTSNIIKEYNITLNPFTYSFNRWITTPSSVGAGLTVKSADDNTQTYELVGGGSPNYIKNFIITPTNVVQSLLFEMGPTRVVTGDIIYNAITDTYLISNYAATSYPIYYMTEYQSNGVVISEIANIVPSIYGLYVYEGLNYAIRSDRLIYRIDPTELVLIGTVPTIPSVNGASQNVTCINATTSTTTTII